MAIVMPLREKTARERNPTTTDIHWAAGLFEGEGNAFAEQVRGHGYACVSMEQGDPWILNRMRSLFGGTVTRRTGTIKLNGKEYRRGYLWILSGARARGFLMTIYGLLSPRRQLQARIALGKEAQGA